MTAGGRFLAGVAAVIREPTGTYLLLHRAADRDFAPGAWECVTGRVEQGEGFEDALHRETREETGLAVTIEAVLGTSHFYRGPPTPEHELLGIVYLCHTSEPAGLRLDAEHSEARWLPLEQAQALLSADDAATAWLRRVLHRVAGGSRGGSFELG